MVFTLSNSKSSTVATVGKYLQEAGCQAAYLGKCHVVEELGATVFLQYTNGRLITIIATVWILFVQNAVSDTKSTGFLEDSQSSKELVEQGQ